MKQNDIVALLGRPLTTVEISNFDNNIQRSIEKLEQILGCDIEQQAESAQATTREFRLGNSQRLLFTNPFTDTAIVTVNDESTTEFTQKQNDSYKTDWYNLIRFNEPLRIDSIINVTAKWGFKTLPADLQDLIAKLFAIVSKPYNATNQIKSKKVEDYSISYGDLSDMELFIKDNSATIDKYSARLGSFTVGGGCRGSEFYYGQRNDI